jgi:hypothetical protein
MSSSRVCAGNLIIMYNLYDVTSIQPPVSCIESYQPIVNPPVFPVPSFLFLSLPFSLFLLGAFSRGFLSFLLLHYAISLNSADASLNSILCGSIICSTSTESPCLTCHTPLLCYTPAPSGIHLPSLLFLRLQHTRHGSKLPNFHA